MTLRCLWAVAPVFFAVGPAMAAPVDYARNIKPLFAAHCVSCHGPTKQKAGLRLDAFAHVKLGGNSGPAIVSKNSTASLLVHALLGDKSEVARMPPKGNPLPAEQIALVKRWIDEGAAGPIQEDVAVAGVGSKHWSFQPVKRPTLPAIKDAEWGRNCIDAFVLARLEKDGLRPSREAAKATLIRRLSLDLLGLPPTPAEVAAFVTDSAADAYERLVDRLLRSPHYGERQARHWLDAARYADSDGFTIDAPRSIWKYRDWVIDAFNRDLPFDRFTVDQLAGDLLPNATTDQRVATGFHRNTAINQEGGIDLEQFRVESVVDRVNTTGAVWLGLTVGCAQCHDHKYDPLAQREYYQLLAFFNNCDEPTIDIQSSEEKARRDAIRAAAAKVAAALKPLDPTTPEAVEKWERGITDATRPALPKAIADTFLVAVNGRNAKQIQSLEAAFRQNDQTRHMVGLMNPWQAAVQMHLLTTRITLHRELAALNRQEKVPVTSMVVAERTTPRETHVMLGGDFTRKGAKVVPGYPAVLNTGVRGANRLDFARWLVDPANPLTARVTVNRWWGQFFGTPLVETDNDFGTQGSPPSHPELLDWLAAEFVARGWGVKSMHKLIVMSAAYRQSSVARPDLEKIDARNRLLARQSRLRVPAETVRDVALAASGLLAPTVGGPSVFPPQPDGVYRFTQIDKGWKTSPGDDRYRRGLYTYFWRSAPHPQLVTFDAPDSSTACTRRNRSNTPLQALTLLNDAGFYEYAQGLVARIFREASSNDAGRLAYAFRVCVAREPSARELARLRALLESQRDDLASKPAEAAAISPTAPDRAAWVTVARVLLNLDETITRE